MKLAAWTKYLLSAHVLLAGMHVMSCSDTAPKDIWDAIVAEDLSRIEALLDQGVDLNEDRESDNRFPLMHATLHRKPKVIEFLIENGADVNGSDVVGSTCILAAAFLGAVDTVQALIEGGADLFRRNIIGEDVLDVLEINWQMTNYYANEVYELGVTRKATEEGRAKVRPNLVQRREQVAKEDVWAALVLGRLDLVKVHVDSVDDIATMVTAEGSPILVAATALGQLEIVRHLVQAGADIESRDAFGSTPLFVAAMFGHEDIAKVLIENEADVYTFNYQGTDLNGALELDWATTSLVAILIGLSLEVDELNKTRGKIKELIFARKSALSGDDPQGQE